MKFISFTNTETSISATKINYASSDNTQLELFIGDLCYLSPQGLRALRFARQYDSL